MEENGELLRKNKEARTEQKIKDEAYHPSKSPRLILQSSLGIWYFRNGSKKDGNTYSSNISTYIQKISIPAQLVHQIGRAHV